MKYSDIKKFPRAYYSVNVYLKYLRETLDKWNEREENQVILNPEWQRGHVWTEKQKISFMEYFLRGGTTGRHIYWNCSSWQRGFNTPIYCVDGLQRISAALDFLDNKIKVFGHYEKEFEDSMRLIDTGFIFNMLVLSNKKELLKVYLDFNSGGTPHNPKELERISKMIKNTPENETI